MKKKLTLFFLLLTLSTQSIFCQCEADYEALMVLYNATNGDNWHDNTNWGVGCTPCADQWKGVACQEVSGELRLTSLNLFSNNLVGQIPPEINQFSELLFINIYQNKLNDTIPKEFGQLSKLLWASMFSNELIGTIPSELGQLSNLVYLALDNNELEGSIPTSFGQLSNMQTLSISGNNLTGGIPIELGQLSKLKTLDLENNNLNGNIPLELGQLSNLEDLELRHNQLSGNIPATLSQLTNLEKLFLGNNQLSGCIPYQFEYFCTQSQVTVHLIGNQDLEEDNFSDFCATQSGACENICADACCCEGEIDNMPPSITGYNPNAAWIDNGWWDKDTFNILLSNYEIIRDSFFATDILVSDNCYENLIIDTLSRQGCDYESSNGICFLNCFHFWKVIDECRKDTILDTLLVKILCDSDIEEVSNAPFVDTINLAIGNPNDYKPGDTIPVLSCSDLRAYIHWEPKIGEFGSCNASARSKIRKRPTTSAFSSLTENTNIIEWVWELELGCSEVANELYLYQISLFFSCTESNNCKTEHIINSNSLNSGIYLAEQTIVSDAVIKTDSSVAFKAGNSITLLENFHAMQGSSFSVEISPVSCENESVTRSKKDATNVKPTSIFSKIYPNPANQQITVEYNLQDEDVQIMIYNLDGKEMNFNILSQKNLRSQQKMVLNISNFPKGFYYLTLLGKERLLTEKIIILD